MSGPGSTTEEVAAPSRVWWPADTLFRQPMAPFSRKEVRRPHVVILAVLVVGRALTYGFLGARHILDDFSVLAAMRYRGVSHGAETLQWGRPFAWLVDTVVYGVGGPHPLVLLAMVTALNLLAVVLLYLVLTRFVSPWLSFSVAALWVLAANHNTLTAWTATAPTVAALVLLLAGILALTDGRWIVAAVCLGLSVLSYELTFPLALAAALLLPSARPLDWKRRLVMAGAVVLATGWVALDPLNSPDYDPPSLDLIWRAHFSDGLLGTAHGPRRLVHYLGDLALVGALACLVAWLVGERERDDGPVLALWGLIVMVLGSVAFVNLGLGQEGIGMQDRLLAVSSIGAVMVVVGSLALLARHLRVVGAIASVLLCLVLVAGQFVSLRAWAAAGDDAHRLTEFVAAVADPSDDHPVDAVVGVGPLEHNGVLGITDGSGSTAAAYQLRFGQHAGVLREATSLDELVAGHPGELVLDWNWIDHSAVLDDGIAFQAAVTVPGPGQAMVYGWAEDGPPGSDPVELEFLVDGKAVDRAVANENRADIAMAIGHTDPNHAFQHAVAVPGGTHTVCVRTVGHGDRSLGCTEVEVLPPP